MTKAKPLLQQKHIQLMDEILAEEIPKIEEQHGVDIWTLNVIYYASAVTILEKEGRLREIRRKKTAKHTPRWQIKLEARIEAIQRKSSYTYILLECKKQEKYTQHQHHIKRKMEKWYGNLTKRRLHQIQLRLKQELKVESHELKNKKLIQERRRINRLFQVAPKTVYRELKEESAKAVNEMPTKEGVEEFWRAHCGEIPQNNKNSPWIKELEEEYCKEVHQKDYEITDEILNKVLTKLANDKPGRDQLAGVWIKRLTSVKGYLKGNLMTMFETDTEPSEELLTSKTILLAKNSETGNPMNYRPTALQNTMYKIYTAILTEFIRDHCEQNEIITIEQAAGRRGSWGCTDQLLINKMMYEEVKTNRRNLATAWLDYKKAFDSMSHTWLIKSLELAKIPTKIIDAIKNL